jgi:hypothetical protein
MLASMSDPDLNDSAQTLICAINWYTGVESIWLLWEGTTIYKEGIKIEAMSVSNWGLHTLPTSVTLTALNNVPESSSMTATLLTPCSLMSRMTSRTWAVLDVATTEEYICREGRVSA